MILRTCRVRKPDSAYAVVFGGGVGGVRDGEGGRGKREAPISATMGVTACRAGVLSGGTATDTV
jgi:hypothetical protein